MWATDLAVNLLMFPGYLIGGAIAYSMVGFENEGIPMVLLISYVAVFSAEQIPRLAIAFCAPNMALGFIVAQSMILCCFLFAGGTFIRDSEVEGTFWVWLMAISPFQHSADAYIASTWRYLNYRCPTDPTDAHHASTAVVWCNMTHTALAALAASAGAPSLTGLAGLTGLAAGGNMTGGVLFGPGGAGSVNTSAAALQGKQATADRSGFRPSGDTSPTEFCCVALGGTYVFPCDKEDSATHCMAKGLSVVDVFKGPGLDMWESLGWLLLVGVAFRALVLLCTIYPPAILLQGTRRALVSFFSCLNAGGSGDGQGRARGKQRRGSTNVPLLCDVVGVDLVFKDITVTLKKKWATCREPRELVSRLSCVAVSGQVTALMGPSGAGKTTLLNALSGMAPHADVAGSATLGGHPFSKDLLGYVPQFDSLLDAFTVRETLTYSFLLKCGGAVAKDHVQLVVELAGLVGLLRLLDVRIGTLVSGQRKLVSVADGLIAKPTVLFLDEPTTGLDSTAAHEVVRYVKKVASTGVTVIMTIHQPSSDAFAMINSMLLLDNTGHVAFDGAVQDAVPYFEAHGYPTMPDDNPADVFLQAMGGVPLTTTGTTWGALYASSDMAREAALRRKSSLDLSFMARDAGDRAQHQLHESDVADGVNAVGGSARTRTAPPGHRARKNSYGKMQTPSKITPVYAPPSEARRLGILIKRMGHSLGRMDMSYCLTTFPFI